MSLLRAIRADLVDKRLWPVALVLVLAVAAVPIVVPKLGGAPAPAASTPPLPAAAAASAAAAHPVSVVADSPWAQHPHGRFHDPFRGPKAAAAPSSAKASSSATTASAGSSGASGGSSAAPSPSGSAPSPSATTPKPAPSPTDPVAVPGPPPAPGPVATASGIKAGYRVDVSWGPTGRMSKHLNIPRLTGMYAGPQPLAALLGVRSGGKVAVFLLSSATSAIGEGSCRPSRLDCQTIEMRVGQAEFLDVPGSPGQSYELKLTRLSVKRTATKAQARAFRRRRAKTGAAMLQQAVADGQTYATRYAYDSAHGVLTLRSAAAAAASAPQGSSQTPVQAGPAASTGSPTGQ